MSDEQCLQAVYDLLLNAPELNMANYYTEDIEELNSAVIEAVAVLQNHFLSTM